MKIGFDVSQTGSRRAGCGYFANSLIRAMADCATNNQFVLYPTFGDFFFDEDWERATYAPEKPNFARGLAHATSRELREFWTAPPDDLEEQLGLPDVIHSNNFFCPTQLRQARLVYTLYDLSFLENPEWTLEANRTGCFEGVFEASLHADHIVAISHFSKRHFLEIFPHYPEERVTVVHLASRFNGGLKVAQPNNLLQLQKDRFWLCVGTLEPRKNHTRLVQAYAKLKAQTGCTFPLVLAGGQGWLTDELSRTIKDLGLDSDVRVTGYLDNDALQWLYQNCYAVLYPSLFEGFGLPVVEALSLGAAVITSRTTSIPEIAGDAALLVDPYREDDIVQAMVRLVSSPSLLSQLRQRGPVQAGRFRWDQAARITLHCYEKAMLSPRLQNVLDSTFVSPATQTVSLVGRDVKPGLEGANSANWH
jgi:glycosyltransferase involved in cell wall biosynthesis